jgi:DNA-binding MarR family transcriptional regulator
MQDNERSAREGEVLRQFRLIYGAMKLHFRAVEAQCGLSGSKMWILQEVRRQPGIGIGEISRKLSVQPSTASILVERLVAENMLHKQRQPEDLRRVGLWLTEAGIAALEKLPGPAEGLLPQALQSVDPLRLEQLASGLHAVLEKIAIENPALADVPLADLIRSGSNNQLE